MLRKVRLRPRGAAEGSFAGPHKSNYRGTAVEFADFRNYVDGDDIRMVDWKVFARTDKHYVRLYEAERNLLSYMVVDASGSMSFTGVRQQTMSKLEYAGRLASAMAYMVVREGDEAGLSVVGRHVQEHLPARSNWPHLAAMVDLLGRVQPEGATDLGTSLMGVFRRVSRRGVLIVLSDFLDRSEGFWKSIDLFRKSQFDVMLFHIVHPEEIQLPEVPLARFRSAESESGKFDVEPEVVRDLYAKRFARHLSGVEANAQKRGCDWFMARTDQDPYLFLSRCFLAREAGGR